jgi:hypothetical protein
MPAVLLAFAAVLILRAATSRAKGGLGSLAPAATHPQDLPQGAPTIGHVDIATRAAEWPYPVVWATVPFRDNKGAKVRPVVVHSFDDDGLVVSPLYSRGRSSDTCYYLKVSQDSAKSYDRKGTPGYIAVTTVLRLPYDAVLDRGREPGQLSVPDRKRLAAAMNEWEVSY